MPVKNQSYSDNKTAFLLKKIKTRQIFTSRNVSFNENNLPDFYNEIEDIENSFLYLDFNEIREELQDASNSSDFSSKVETTEAECVQENENNTETEVEQKTRQEKLNPNVKPKTNILYNIIQKSQQKKTEK